MHPNEPRELSKIVEILDAGGYRYLPQTDPTQLRAQCPGHDGSKPAAWFRERIADNGHTYVNVTCFTEGCSDVTIYAALGLVAEGHLSSTKDFVKPVGKSSGKSIYTNGKFSRAEWLASQFSGFDMDTMEVKNADCYVYTQYNGQPFADKSRLQAYDKITGERVLTDQKSFQWSPKRKDWPAPHPPLYGGRYLVENLKLLQAGDWEMPERLSDVWGCESEKSVRGLIPHDRMGVSGHTGSGTRLQPADLGLLKTYTDTTGGTVMVCRDLDESGTKFAKRWTGQLAAAGIRFRVVESATGVTTHDIYDHLQAGLGFEELVDITNEYSTTSVSAK